jgi:hypothetical protein
MVVENAKNNGDHKSIMIPLILNGTLLCDYCTVHRRGAQASPNPVSSRRVTDTNCSWKLALSCFVPATR